MANAMFFKFAFCSCGQGFSKKEELIEHQKMCGDYCVDCDKHYASRETLRRHRRVQHREASTLRTCYPCGYAVDCLSEMKKHEKSWKHRKKIISVSGSCKAFLQHMSSKNDVNIRVLKENF